MLDLTEILHTLMHCNGVILKTWFSRRKRKTRQTATINLKLYRSVTHISKQRLEVLWENEETRMIPRN